MYSKAFVSAILAGQVANAAILPRVVTVHLTSTVTTYVPPTTSDAGPTPSNVAPPAEFASQGDAGTTLVTLSSFSDAFRSGASKTDSPATVTVTEPVPIFVTVTDCDCTASTAAMISSAEQASSPTVSSSPATSTDLPSLPTISIASSSSSVKPSPSSSTSKDVAPASSTATQTPSSRPKTLELSVEDVYPLPNSAPKSSSTPLLPPSEISVWSYPLPNKTSSSEPIKSSKTPDSTSSKACVYPIPGECGI